METGVCLNQEEEPVLFLLQLNVDSVKAQSSVSLTVQMEEKSLSIKTEEIKSSCFQAALQEKEEKQKPDELQPAYQQTTLRQPSLFVLCSWNYNGPLMPVFV